MSVQTAQSIINKCKTELNDSSSVTWTESELLGYLNDAQRAVVNKKPEAYVTTEAVVLVAGTKQSIPANGHSFVTANCNMGTAGTVEGETVLEEEMVILDRVNRGWRTETASSTVESFLTSPDPKVFYVSPPQPTSSFGYLEIVYSIAPADILIGAVLLIEDIYANAIRYHMMARAHTKETEEADSQQVGNFMALFNNELGG